jgi:hypothetical protein
MSTVTPRNQVLEDEADIRLLFESIDKAHHTSQQGCCCYRCTVCARRSRI